MEVGWLSMKTTSCALKAKSGFEVRGKWRHRKDLASGTQRTEGGGEPRPIRGTFSYRGFPPKRAVWFLRKNDTNIQRLWELEMFCSAHYFHPLTCTQTWGRWRRPEQAGAGCSGCPCCCCSCRSCACWCGWGSESLSSSSVGWMGPPLLCRHNLVP